MDVDFDSRLIVNGGRGNRIGQYLRDRCYRKYTFTITSNGPFGNIWEDNFSHWAVLLSLGITTFQTPVCLRYSFNHSSISSTTIHRHKTCINCRVKKMTT